jgi:hypothetical protein
MNIQKNSVHDSSPGSFQSHHLRNDMNLRDGRTLQRYDEEWFRIERYAL